MAKEKIKELKSRLLALIKIEALRKGKFILSSGKISNYYLNGRVITLSSEGAYLVAQIILDSIKGKDIEAIGGPTLGADPIVGAIACLSYINKLSLKTFIVRKSAKGHGMGRQIEGPTLRKDSRVILVDDVATTGNSLHRSWFLSWPMPRINVRTPCERVGDCFSTPLLCSGKMK